MKKKISIVLIVLFLCLSAAIPAFAYADDNNAGFADEYYRLNDTAYLLTEKEEAEILDLLDEISLRQCFELAIVTTDSLDGYTAREYADDLYDYCRFGYGKNRDGAMLLVSMEEREWYITTCGYGITAFTDAGIDYIGKQVSGYLSDGDYAEAFRTFANLGDQFVTQARNGEPFDKSSLPKGPLPAFWILIALAVGLVIALIVVGGMKAQLNTVRSQAEAGNYVREGSFRITESNDLFLYRKVDRVARPKEESSGSSTHVSSSGTTHGGGGGSF